MALRCSSSMLKSGMKRVMWEGMMVRVRVRVRVA